MPTVFYQL